MRGARSTLILVVVTAAAIAGVVFVDREPVTAEHGGEAVFPGLLERVNSVARVRVTGKEGTFALVRDGDAWVVEEKERYAADPNRVHRLLLGAAGMRRFEPKTGNPELYPKLWLEDPSGEDAKSVRFVLEDASGAELANWVLGDRRPSKSDAARTEIYIRVADDPMAWLVEGSVPGGPTILDWLDRTVAGIDRGRLRAVEVAHADGTVITVDRSSPADTDFTLRDIPAGREADSRYRINDIGRFLEDLRFEDVAPSSELVFSGTPDKRVEVVTFDGLRIRMETAMRDGEAWARLRAEVDEGLIEKPEDAAGTSADEAGATPRDASGSLLPIEEVRAEAERLNARWAGWAYELPSFKRDYLAKRMDELTRAPEETDAGKDGSES